MYHLYVPPFSYYIVFYLKVNVPFQRGYLDGLDDVVSVFQEV